MAQRRVAKQRTRQRRRLKNWYLVFLGQSANAQGHQIAALGHHTRRAHVLVQVLQRHREVGRVGDDDVGLGYFGHHAALGNLLLLAADLRLDLWIAVAFLAFLAQVLARHAQLARVAP